MSKPLKYILNSDYATLANDSEPTTITVSIPAGTAIPVGDTVQYTGTATIGNAGAPLYYTIMASNDNRRYITKQLSVNGGDYTNGPSILVRVNRSSATTVIVRVFAYAISPGTVTVAQTFTVNIRTLVPPFN